MSDWTNAGRWCDVEVTSGKDLVRYRFAWKVG